MVLPKYFLFCDTGNGAFLPYFFNRIQRILVGRIWRISKLSPELKLQILCCLWTFQKLKIENFGEFYWSRRELYIGKIWKVRQRNQKLQMLFWHFVKNFQHKQYTNLWFSRTLSTLFGTLFLLEQVIQNRAIKKRHRNSLSSYVS